MRIETINVGDGACAIASETNATIDLTMIDCGRWRQGDKQAADRAEVYLGDRLGDVTTLVVTHFDRDHWAGLVRLASVHAELRPKDECRISIRIPGMPDAFASKLRAGMLGLISVRDNVPVNAIELMDAWVSTGAKVEQTAHFAGDLFEANGREWAVLWPPRTIPDVMGTRITTWLQDLRTLAEEMAQAGQPILLENLRRAYADGQRFAELTLDSPSNPDAPTWSTFEEDVPRSDADAHPEGADSSAVASHFQVVPSNFRVALEGLAKRMSSLDNALSLVIASSDDFIDFGDIEGAALEGLHGTKSVRPAYKVMLAPHHGTHDAPDWLPEAGLCVSQNGVDHHRKNGRHKQTHVNLGRCVSTWDHGNIDVETDWMWRTPYMPWWHSRP